MKVALGCASPRTVRMTVASPVGDMAGMSSYAPLSPVARSLLAGRQTPSRALAAPTTYAPAVSWS
jgi:hypothetical protein